MTLTATEVGGVEAAGVSSTPLTPPAPATFYTISGGGDTFWRASAPAGALGAKVVKVPDKAANDVLLYPSGRHLVWFMRARLADGTVKSLRSRAAWERFRADSPRVTDVWAEFPEHEGVAVFNRPDLPRAVFAAQMQERGIVTVAETDDNYFSPEHLNLFLRQQKPGEDGRMNHAKSMASMQRNVFSTPALRDIYHREYRERFGKAACPELFVCRNSLPRDQWPTVALYDGALRVGFMGSPSHVWDLAIAYPAFAAAKAMGCRTMTVGYNPADPDPGLPDDYQDDDGEMKFWRTPKSLAAKEAWGSVLTDQGAGWVNPEDYQRGSVPFDISLCPLLHNRFTAGKSDVKAIESTVSGAAVVCSSVPVFSSAGWVDGENCLMAGSAPEMAAQTVRLIRDPALRAALVESARAMVRETRNEETLRSEWGAVLHG